MSRWRHIALIGEASPAIGALADYLSDLGYQTHIGRSLAQCATLFQQQTIDVVVLHRIASPDGGLDDLRQLRDASQAVIVMVTATPDVVDRIAGLEIGADDVVIAPVEPQEIAARIGGIISRRGLGGHDVLRFENTAVDLAASRLLRVGRRPERLGPGEITLIKALTRHPHRVLSRDDLMDMAPAESLEANDRSIDTRVARLRRKLDTATIVTVRGHGYMFVPPFEDPT